MRLLEALQSVLADLVRLASINQSTRAFLSDLRLCLTCLTWLAIRKSVRGKEGEQSDTSPRPRRMHCIVPGGHRCHLLCDPLL